MRIALVVEEMDPSRGGRERSLAELAQALTRRGCSVIILCQTSAWRSEGIEVVPLGCRGNFRVDKLRNFIEDVQRISDLRNFSLVHSTVPLPGAQIYQLRSGTIPAQQDAALRRRSGVARMGSRIGHSLNLRRQYLAQLEEEVVNQSEVSCLAVSRLVATELATHYNRVDGVRVIYNAVAVSKTDLRDQDRRRIQCRARLGVRQKETLVVTLAMNFELKGVAETLKAFAVWQGGQSVSRGHLAVVGQKQPAGYQRLARRLGIGHLVTFVPPTNDVRCWYAAADVCMLLSWYDPCSRVILEATCFGVPSITTSHNGAAETLLDGAGIVIDSPRSINDAAKALEQLADREEHRGFRAACTRQAGHLSTERHVGELIDTYEQVLGGYQLSSQRLLQVKGASGSLSFSDTSVNKNHVNGVQLAPYQAQEAA